MRHAWLLLICLVAACAPAGAPADAGQAGRIQERSFYNAYGAVYRAAARVAADMRWDVRRSNPVAGLFTAKTPPTEKRPSDEVSVMVYQEGNEVRLRVESGASDPSNRRYVAEFIDRVAAALGQ